MPETGRPTVLDPALYLGSTRTVEAESPQVVHLAQDLTDGCTDAVNSARVLFEYVRDRIRYDFAPKIIARGEDFTDDFKATRTLKDGSGACVQKAVLLAALARAVEIPTALAYQTIEDFKLDDRYIKVAGNRVIPHHAYNCMWLEGRWIPLDATLDRELITRKGYRLVEFDAHEGGLLPATDMSGRPHFRILEEHGCFADVPPIIHQNMSKWRKASRERGWFKLVHREDVSM